ncbi:MAG: PHB depolymerase family esterase [Rhodobacterales bacterium]|nr:PHB depolymerase family esterase [Rhodobacterales bacterium]
MDLAESAILGAHSFWSQAFGGGTPVPDAPDTPSDGQLSAENAKKATVSPVPRGRPQTSDRSQGAKANANGLTPQNPDRPVKSRAKTTASYGGSFTKGVHTSEFGTRSFKLYSPAAAETATAPLPLLVMLHGCSQTPDDFAQGTGMNALAEEFGFLVVYPAQERKSQTYGCWNWYRRGDQSRGGGEPALIASLTRYIIGEHEADPAKVYIAGLSAGASAALIVAAAYPDIFAAVGAHSGVQIGAAHDEISAMVAMQQGAPGLGNPARMPTISFHGASDNVVHPRNGGFIAARALEPYPCLRKTETTGHVAGGRHYLQTSHSVGRGRSLTEHWVVAGAPHGWSGGNAAGSYTDPSGPDASREMVRFFLRHRTTVKQRSPLLI